MAYTWWTTTDRSHQDPDPDLFVAADGRPMTFTMSYKDQEAFKVTMNAENAMWQI